MKDGVQLLFAYLKASSGARPILSGLKGCKDEDIDIQAALVEVLDLKEPMDVLSQELTEDDIVRLLKDFDFDKLRPEILGEIELDESVIPDGIPQLLTEVTIRSNGEQWRIHQNDADPFPSNPHAVRLGDGMKLDLSNGCLYRKKQCLGRIKYKHLLLIHQKAKEKYITMPSLRE